MEIFFTADQHFDHAMIIQHDKRPFENAEEMNETLIKNWNDMIGRKDLVYIVGDFAFKRHLHFFGALNGHKILIRGNHDKSSRLFLEQFTGVYDLLKAKIYGQQIVLCHYALRSWPASNYRSWHFYGHSHGTLLEYPDRKCCDVGVDVWNFKPIPFSVLKAKMESKESPKYPLKENMNEYRENLIKENAKWREILKA